MGTQHRLAELLGSLSLATESTAGVAPETASRAAVLGVHLAQELGFDAAARRDAFYAALLRYIGCSGFAHETAFYGAGDDIGLLRALNPVDGGSPADVVARVVRGAGRGAGALGRARAVARVLSSPSMPRDLARAHCDQAVQLAARLGLGPGVTSVLGQLYERFNGRGGPLGLRGETLEPLARVLHVAFRAELHRGLDGPAEALAVVRARRRGELDPRVAERFLARGRELLALVAAPSVWETMLAAEPEPHLLVDDARVPDVALAFAHFVDLKSPWTLGHSTGVARLCVAALERAGAPPSERAGAHLAALLHDLGRASVSNGIWDSGRPLGALEWERVRAHSEQSERVLRRSALLRAHAPLVGAHHERLDGSGYNRGLRDADLPRAARYLAASDVYAALTEDRAHRAKRAPADAARILLDEAAAGRLERAAVERVLEAAGVEVARGRRGAPAPAGLSEREVEVLRLLARGLSNKEIGSALAISARTVGHHVAHVYGKTGVRTRAAAALFAVEHALIEA